MRLSSKPTPTPLNGEDTKPTRNAKRKGNGMKAYPKRRKNVNENHRHVAWKGEGGMGQKRVDGKAKTQSSATTAAKGGEAKLYHRKGEK